MSVLILDYGLCNLNSIRKAVEQCGAEVIVSCDPNDIASAEKIILPGVGAFPDAMRNLSEYGLLEPLINAVREGEIPLLGICLGMQLLADSSEEKEFTRGLGLISGKVVKLNPVEKNEKIPHVGWNEIHQTGDCILLDNIPNGTDFYFVHSYHFIPTHNENAMAITPYCGRFVSVVAKKRIYGTQFHPEKSMPLGLKVIKNFIETG